MSILGIKSVDFLIRATGEGVVNHNGAYRAFNPAASKTVSNHLFPKLRGVDPFQKIRSNQDGQDRTMSIRLDDPDIGSAALIVSAACIRAGLFRDVSHGLQEVTTDNAARVLAGLHGLVRGYLITRGGRNMARKSPLHVTDFECVKPGLAFSQGNNQHVRGTEREDTSLYSYYTTGKDLEYTGKATLSVEDLRFIPLEDSLGRSAYDFTTSVAEGERVAGLITEYLQLIAPAGSVPPQARFVKKALRRGAIEPVGDAGVLLDDAAVRVVADEVRRLFEGLSIRQGKGYLAVTEVQVDYNDTTSLFRGARRPGEMVNIPTGTFAAYYEEEAIDDAQYELVQRALESERTARERKKALTKAERDQAKKDKKAQDKLSAKPTSSSAQPGKKKALGTDIDA